jgi:hypothetical protein
MISRVMIVLVLTLFCVLPSTLVRAQSGDGITSGNWNIRPYAEVGVAFDDNVYRSGANEVDDVYFDPKAGLLFRTSAEATMLTLSGGGFYNRREYMDESSRNNDSYGVGLSLELGFGEKSTAQIVAGYRLIEDEDTFGPVTQLKGVNRGLIQDIDASSKEREVVDAGVAFDRTLSDRTTGSLGLIYSALDYDDPAALDLTGVIGQGSVDHDLTDKLGVFGLARVGMQEQDGDNQTADSIVGQLGLSLKPTDKLTLRAGAGAESYSREIPGQEDIDTDNFSFSLVLDLQATDKLKLSAGAYNGTQLSSAFSDNAIEFLNSFIGARFDVSSTLDLNIRAVYRKDDFVDPIVRDGVSVDREDERIQLVVRANYRPPVDYLQVFAQVSTEDVDSSIQTIDYTRTVVMGGVSVAY